MTKDDFSVTQVNCLVGLVSLALRSLAAPVCQPRAPSFQLPWNRKARCWQQITNRPTWQNRHNCYVSNRCLSPRQMNSEDIWEDISVSLCKKHHHSCHQAPPRPAPVPGGQCDQQTNRKLGRQQACENVPQAWRSHAVLSNNATCISGLIIFLVNPLDAQNRVQDTFWAQPAKTRPFTTSTGFLLISPVANLLPSIWTGQYPIIFFQVPTNYFFIVTTSGQELGYWYVSRFSNVARLWNAIMKQKLCMFVVHQTAISLQCTKHLNPRTRWYPALHEPNRIKPTYVTSHPGKNPPPQSSYRLEIRLAS